MGAYASTLLSVLMSGVLILYGMARWTEASAESYTVDDLKQALLEAGGIAQMHHEVYAAVGEQAWEETVKPGFMMNLTMQVALDTNNVFPGPEDILKWAAEHPAETRQMLERYVTAPSPTGQ